ncbi:MAG: ABC transporter permease [bacterium]|nr:ABC transporter permease [bacterium]
MIRAISAKYAFRSLFRHTRRTLLSIVGVGVGCSIALISASWMSGSSQMQIRAISESGGGHLRIVPSEWIDTRDDTLRLTDPDATLEQVRAIPGVVTAVPRARVNGLLAFGNRTGGIRIVGVDPILEEKSNRIVYKSQLEGRYLRPDDRGAVVIGKALATRLDVELEDDLYATLVGKDEIQSAMLRIVGLLDTGSRDLDTMLCHVTLADLNEMTGYEGPGEISIMLEDYKLIKATREKMTEFVPQGNTLITWREVNPGMAANVDGDTAFTRSLMGIIVIVVALGIASAQLTAVLERRTEFAILTALGMKARQVIALVVLEALMVGLGGAVVATGIGGSVAYYLATHGVNFKAMMGEDFSFGDVLLDPYLYGDFGLWLVWYALAISVTTTLAASVYPAWRTTRIDPADSLRTV